MPDSRETQRAEARLNSPRHERQLERQAAAMAGASGGCLLAVAALPFTMLAAALRRK